MQTTTRLIGFLALVMGGSVATVGGASDWYAAPGGTEQGQGTRQSPWNLATALGGSKAIQPGDTLWILAGTYRHADRKLGSSGYVVRLAGTEGRPIQVRGEPGRRVTLDGALTVQAPATHVWIRDLELLISENLTMSRELNEPGSHPQSYQRPWGGLNVHAGSQCKYIHLVIHDTAQGVSFWSGATDSELYGCIIYDNGWKAPDRGHGHAIYTQNKDGVKTIADCILTGGYGYTLHAYGSERAFVDHYQVEGNIAYNGGRFLIGGGSPSHDIRVVGNLLHQVGMQLGYAAPYNEDCEVRNNVIVGGDLQIQKYRRVVNEGNLVLGRNDPRPTDPPVRVEIRPSRYDAQRAHVAVLNWSRQLTVELRPGAFLPGSFLKAGDRYRIVDPKRFYEAPIAQGVFDGSSIRVPLPGEFAAFVLLRRNGSD
jgi:hypothetical protein